MNRGLASDGTAVDNVGDYVTIWRRGTDGSWKAIIDIGNAHKGRD